MSHPLVAAVARVGLERGPSSLVNGPADGSITDDEVVVLLRTARQHRLTGLVAEAVRQGLLPVTDHQISLVDGAAVEAAAHEVQVEALLVEILGWLDDTPLRVLKGPSAAHRFYPDPAHRGFADLDLLVPSVSIDRAVSSLTSYGLDRLVPQLRRGFDRRFAKSVTLRTDSGIEVDLHRTLAPAPYGLRIHESQLWERAEPFHLAGETVPTLPSEETLVHAAVHIAAGRNVRLMSLRDLLQISQHPMDMDRVEWLVDQWGLHAVMRHATTAAHRKLGVEPTEILGWAQRLPVTAAQIRELTVALDRGDAAGRERLGFTELDGWVDRLRYAAALVWPSNENLAARGRTRRRHLRLLRSRISPD